MSTFNQKHKIIPTIIDENSRRRDNQQTLDCSAVIVAHGQFPPRNTPRGFVFECPQDVNIFFYATPGCPMKDISHGGTGNQERQLQSNTLASVICGGILDGFQNESMKLTSGELVPNLVLTTDGYYETIKLTTSSGYDNFTSGIKPCSLPFTIPFHKVLRSFFSSADRQQYTLERIVNFLNTNRRVLLPFCTEREINIHVPACMENASNEDNVGEYAKLVERDVHELRNLTSPVLQKNRAYGESQSNLLRYAIAYDKMIEKRKEVSRFLKNKPLGQKFYDEYNSRINWNEENLRRFLPVTPAHPPTQGQGVVYPTPARRIRQESKTNERAGVFLDDKFVPDKNYPEAEEKVAARSPGRGARSPGRGAGRSSLTQTFFNRRRISEARASLEARANASLPNSTPYRQRLAEATERARAEAMEREAMEREDYDAN